MQNIVYFKICNDENEYKGIHPYKAKKYKFLNYIMEHIYYCKIKISAQWNVIDVIKENNKKIYIIYSTLANKQKVLCKIENKISQILHENKNTQVIISKQIKNLINENKDEKNIKRLNRILENSKENKIIYKDFLNEIMKSIIKLKKEIPEEQSIYILLNSNNSYYIDLINKMIADYKMINIVTQNVERFKIFEENAEEKLEPVSILNNKRKSIARAKYIINFDYNYEEIIGYYINRTAVIFNISNNSIKNLSNFDGIIINNIKINKKEKEFDIEDEYIIDKLYGNDISEDIKAYKYTLEGNNGKIEFKDIL